MFIVLRRQFYDPPKATICDICDDRQCSQDCLLARQRQEEEEAKRGNFVSCAITNLFFPPLILITAFLALFNAS